MSKPYGIKKSNDKAYYFISYMYGASEKTCENMVIDEHPLVWQKRVNKSYPRQYVLMNWVEINHELYYNYISEVEGTDYRLVDYIIENLSDAENILNSLKDIANCYGCASVADYYEYLGETAKYLDTKHGWSDESIKKACIVPIPNRGVSIKFPPVEVI